MADPAHFHTSAKPLNPVNIKPPENSVKGAVKLDAELGFYLDSAASLNSEVPAQLVTFDKVGDRPATPILLYTKFRLSISYYAIFTRACKNEHLDVSCDYSLIFFAYITMLSCPRLR